MTELINMTHSMHFCINYLFIVFIFQIGCTHELMHISFLKSYHLWNNQTQPNWSPQFPVSTRILVGLYSKWSCSSDGTSATPLFPLYIFIVFAWRVRSSCACVLYPNIITRTLYSFIGCTWLANVWSLVARSVALYVHLKCSNLTVFCQSRCTCNMPRHQIPAVSKK